ncbi:MAG TPA: gamma-glutamyltransferase [Candidatus Binatia bacterium]|nr:gamma-glutamyltransferase [Candidatus Binatia bacterium]
MIPWLAIVAALMLAFHLDTAARGEALGHPALAASQASGSNTPVPPVQSGTAADQAAGEIAQPHWPSAAVRSTGAMVVSDEPLANEAGLEILRQGGNAVDAAVAVAFALAVVEPQAGNIGGGGFLLLRMTDGRASFIDYRETAPLAAKRDMYLRPDGTLDSEAATLGYRASGVPGTVAGMDLALHVWGTLSLQKVMAPAIRLAAEGFPVSDKLAHALEAAKPRLERFSRSRKIFLRDGRLYRPGEIFRQPELARTFRRIVKYGVEEFYTRGTAFALARDVQRNKGLLTMADLFGYRPKVREPLRVALREDGVRWEVFSAPPPSSGGVALAGALQMLAPELLGRWDLQTAQSPEGAERVAQSVHWIAEALRRVFADRATFLADPDFFHVPVRGLIDSRYAAERRATISPERASSSKEVHAGNPLPFDGPLAPDQHVAQLTGGGREAEAAAVWPPAGWEPSGPEHGVHTTHFSVVDKDGNAVANTFTLNDSFGSAVTAPGGFLLNDTMDDFTTQPGVPNKLFNLIQSEQNTIAPGRRPVSSMTPTIVLRDGKLSFVTGSPGGPRIVSATLLSVLYWMRFGGDPQTAINAPRMHHQWMPDILYVEQAMPPGVVHALEARGYTVKSRDSIGQVNAIGIDPVSGDRLGAPDARRAGAAAGIP